MGNKEKKRGQELLKQVFKLISESYFGDNKLLPYYCSHVKFPRSLGTDIANYLQSLNDDYYRKLQNNWEEKIIIKRGNRNGVQANLCITEKHLSR